MAKNFHENKLTNELYEWLKAKGVRNFVFVIGDPDFNVTGRGHGDSAIWAIGSLRSFEHELKQVLYKTEIIPEEPNDPA